MIIFHKLTVKSENQGERMAMESNYVKVTDETREDFSEYVAHLQFHMTLQARNLVPSLKENMDTDNKSREELLHQTQADFEKLISRQTK